MERRPELAVRFPDDIREAMFAHARACYPTECCGYLRGAAGADGVTATSIVQCRNAQLEGEHPTHPDRGAETGFVIAGRELFEFARSFATDQPACVVYHSHPNGRAYFSEIDRANAVTPDGPAYPVQHLVLGVTAEGVTELAIYAWAADAWDFHEVARMQGEC